MLFIDFWWFWRVLLLDWWVARWTCKTRTSSFLRPLFWRLLSLTLHSKSFAIRTLLQNTPALLVCRRTKEDTRCCIVLLLWFPAGAHWKVTSPDVPKLLQNLWEIHILVLAWATQRHTDVHVGAQYSCAHVVRDVTCIEHKLPMLRLRVRGIDAAVDGL